MREKKETKVKGAVIRSTPTLHGRAVKLIRGGAEVNGVLMSKNIKQGPTDNLIFKWNDKNGVSCISDVTKTELEKIKHPDPLKK